MFDEKEKHPPAHEGEPEEGGRGYDGGTGDPPPKPPADGEPPPKP